MTNISARAFSLLAAVAFCGLPACKEPPSPALEHLKKADDGFRKQDFAAAAAAMDAALAADPKLDAKAIEKAAFAHMKAGNHDKAAALLQKTIGPTAKKEDRLEAYRNIAGMYLSASVHDKAEHWFLEVMKLDPKDEQSLSWLAEIASIRGGARRNVGEVDAKQLEVAIGRYDQVIALNPSAPGPYINKRIALGRLIGALAEQKNVAARDAAESKDKAKSISFKETAQQADARIAELKAKLDETNKQLGEINKARGGAAKAAKK